MKTILTIVVKSTWDLRRVYVYNKSSFPFRIENRRSRILLFSSLESDIPSDIITSLPERGTVWKCFAARKRFNLFIDIIQQCLRKS